MLERWGNEPELTSDENYVHEVIKTSGIFKDDWEVLVKSPYGDRKLRTTTRLTVEQFIDFLKRIESICEKEGVYIPVPPSYEGMTKENN